MRRQLRRAQAPELQLAHRLAGEGAQRFALRHVERPWLAVGHAHGAEREAVLGDERHAGVKADVWRVDHQRAAGEPRIGRRIRDREQVALPDRVRAE